MNRAMKLLRVLMAVSVICVFGFLEAILLHYYHGRALLTCVAAGLVGILGVTAVLTTSRGAKNKAPPRRRGDCGLEEADAKACAVLGISPQALGFLREISVGSEVDTLKEIVEFASRGKFLYLKLSAALVHYENRVLLVKLRSGEFKGFWGLPAGYVRYGTEEWRDPERKAKEEISNYLGSSISGALDRVFLAQQFQVPLKVDYGGFAQVEAFIYPYYVSPESVKLDASLPAECALLDIRSEVLEKGIKDLDGAVNPLVYDVLTEYKGAVFSSAQAMEFERAKRNRRSINELLEAARRVSQAATSNSSDKEKVYAE